MSKLEKIGDAIGRAFIALFSLIGLYYWSKLLYIVVVKLLNSSGLAVIGLGFLSIVLALASLFIYPILILFFLIAFTTKKRLKKAIKSLKERF